MHLHQWFLPGLSPHSQDSSSYHQDSPVTPGGSLCQGKFMARVAMLSAALASELLTILIVQWCASAYLSFKRSFKYTSSSIYHFFQLDYMRYCIYHSTEKSYVVDKSIAFITVHGYSDLLSCWHFIWSRSFLALPSEIHLIKYFQWKQTLGLGLRLSLLYSHSWIF